MTAKDRADIAEMRRLAHLRFDGQLTQAQLDAALKRVMEGQGELFEGSAKIRKLEG